MILWLRQTSALVRKNAFSLNLFTVLALTLSLPLFLGVFVLIESPPVTMMETPAYDGALKSTDSMDAVALGQVHSWDLESLFYAPSSSDIVMKTMKGVQQRDPSLKIVGYETKEALFNAMYDLDCRSSYSCPPVYLFTETQVSKLLSHDLRTAMKF